MFLEATDYHYKMLKDAELEAYCMYYAKQSVTGYVEKNRGECLYAAKLYERHLGLNGRCQFHTNSHCKFPRRNEADLMIKINRTIFNELRHSHSYEY
jgi:hypothetical protein